MVHYIDKSNYVKNKKDNENIAQDLKKGYLTSKFVEFCKRTDLHGYKYIVMEDLNMFERSCWGLAVLVSTGFAAFFVVTAYKWYARNPIVTVIESTQGAIWDIPFPAVTICNLNVISRKAARRFADNVTLPVNVTADAVFEAIRFAPILHSTFAPEPKQKTALRMLQSILELNSISVDSMFKSLSPTSSCDQLVQRCMWKNTIYRCDMLFQQVFTYFAVCCSFNYFAIENLKLKSQSGVSEVDSPRRVASCGYQTALTVLIDTDPQDYYSTSVASQGALVLIDNAYNMADLDSPVRLVNPATEVLIALSPERTFTTAGIRGFKPEDRQCYYIDEVQIANFRQYSFHNCMAFQKVEYIKTVCDCVPYYFPLKDYHRMCNFNDLDCLETFLTHNRNKSNMLEHESAYQCLPECEHYDYPLEVALGKLAKDVRLDGLPFFNDLNLENRSLINVFFNDLVSTRYRRDVYLNWQNLLASFGGLLSLMLGFTLISGFDLILFFTFGLVYGSLNSTTDHSNDVEQKHVEFHKRNKIYVQEKNKHGNFPKKKVYDRESGKWRTEVQYGVHNRY